MYKLIFLLVVSFVSAQQYRFTYSYQMKPDAGKKDSVITDYMNLDTDGMKSYFYNAAKYEKDSAYAVTRNFRDLLQAKSYDQNLSYIVQKDYGKKEINFYDQFKTIRLVIPENEVPKWKIEKEFIKINGISCQKATARYKGRVWEAWFSKEYPINDGPYKFSGLPGIVVSIKDSENDHAFNLIQIKKINKIFSLLPKSVKKMTFTEYKKIMRDYTFNSEDIENMSVNKQENRIDLQLKDGYIAKIGADEMKKMNKMDEEMTKRLRRTNNNIERE
jgi:GLPGLI family protein